MAGTETTPGTTPSTPEPRVLESTPGGVGVLLSRPAVARRQDPDLTRRVALLDASHPL